MVNIAKKVCYRIYCAFLSFDGRIFRKFKCVLLRCLTGCRLEDLYVGPDVFISGYQNLKIGKNFSCHRWSYFSAEGGLTIGSDVSIAHGCSILTSEHIYDSQKISIKKQGVKFKKVIIGDNVWVGANVTILAGAHIPSDSIIAAGSLVNKSFLANNIIIGGVPARVLKKMHVD